MSDWRQNTPPQRSTGKSFQKAKPERSKPAGAGGWRTRQKHSKTVQSTAAGPAGRSWVGDSDPGEDVSLSSLSRWGLVGLLLVIAVSLTSFFIVKAWFKPKRLPIFVFSVGEYDNSRELVRYPFGNLQRQHFFETNPANTQVYQSVQNDNEYALKELVNADWLTVFDKFQKFEINPGGPDEAFVLFYVAAYACIDTDRIHVYSHSDNPYAKLRGNAQAETGIPLERLLTNLSGPVSGDGIAWIVLDLQPPLWQADAAYTNIPWREAVQRAISRVPSELQARMLVTLPCDNWQNNWIAPEFSGTFFGHYFREIISGGDRGDSLFNQDVRLRDFRDQLARNVMHTVSIRRYARQEPVWLPRENLEKFDNFRVATRGSESPPAPVTSPAELATAKYWRELVQGEYQRPYRWDPLGTAEIEMQLLALEDIACYSPEDYQQALTRIESAFQTRRKPKVNFEVSLIEDHQRQLYFHGRSHFDDVIVNAEAAVGGLVDGPRKWPEFWEPESTDPQQEPLTSSPQSNLSPEDRSMFVWRVYATIAASNDPSKWEVAFDKRHLGAAVEYSGQAGNRLEICLLERILESFDWARRDSNRAEACAATVAMFAELQEIGTLPNPQLSWWLKSELPSIESGFLHACDHLLAGDSSAALRRLQSLRSQLNELKMAVQQLQQSLELTDRSLHDLPHYLYWLLSDYQFAAQERLPSIERLLTDLGKAAAVTRSLHRALSAIPSLPLDESLLENHARLHTLLRRMEEVFDEYVEKRTAYTITARAKQSPETFRCERLVLRMPMLTPSIRQRLQQNTRKFLSEFTDGSAAEDNISIPPQRDLQAVFRDHFLNEIAENLPRWTWLALQDARFQLPRFFESFDQPASDSTAAFRSSAQSIEFWQRLFASTIGSHPTLIRELTNDQAARRCPWSVATQRWSLAEANRRGFQIERLAEASWGNARFTSDTAAGEFLFSRLAANYQSLPAQFHDFEPLSYFQDGLAKRMDDSLAEAAQRLQGLQVQFGDSEQTVVTTGEQQARVRVKSEHAWKATVQVLLGSLQARLPWVREDPLPLIVNLEQQSEFQQLKKFDATYWNRQPPVGSLAIRGNQLVERLDWEQVQTKQRLSRLTLDSPPPEGAQVLVHKPSQPPKITVLFLFDCSNSMNAMVNVTEQGQARKRKVFDLVKAAAIQVLNRLEDLHEKEASINLGLLPFGIDVDGIDPNRKRSLILRSSDAGRIRPLTGSWYGEIRDSIEALQASGDTPLYNTISLATELARQRRDQRVFLYAFTDGVDYISDLERSRKSVTHRDVESILQDNPRIQLNIFHFDFFESWLNGIKQPTDEGIPVEEQKRYWRKVEEDGRDNLEELKKLGSEHYLYARSNQASVLMQRSLESVPGSQATIRSLPNDSQPAFEQEPQPLGEPIEIPPEFLPNKFEVVVEGPYGQAFNQFEAIGGEQLRLAFDSQAGQLMFPEFATSGKVSPPTARGEGLEAELYVKTFVEKLHEGQLGFELSFWNGSRTEFTTRPRFIVVEATPVGGHQGLEPMILADHYFHPGTHYPEARVSDIPWLAEQRPAVQLRVWAATSVPAEIRQETLQPNQPQSLSLGRAEVKLVHSGRQVSVEVNYDRRPRLREKVVLTVPQQAFAEHTYDAITHQENYLFEVPTKAINQPAVVQLATVEQLEALVIDDKLKQFEFSSITLPSR